MTGGAVRHHHLEVRVRHRTQHIRKLLLTGPERLDGTGVDRMLLGLRVGDPDDEVLGAWLTTESVRDIYLAENVYDAEILMPKRSRAAGWTPSARCDRSG